MPRPEAQDHARSAESGRSRAGASLCFDAIGAPWEIVTPEPLADETVGQIHARIDAFDAAYSRFRDDSLVRRIAKSPGRYRLPDDAAPLLDLYRALHRATGGAVSPLVGHRLEHLGYDRDYSFRVTGDPAGVPVWNDDTALWDGVFLTTREPLLLDVGAAGKGYLVDLVAGVLDASGAREYVIDASGDLLHRGDHAIRIALEHPSDSTLAIGVVELSNAALCASAANRRTWGDGLHHVIDARTGAPASEVVATWAIAPTALVADGLATALFFAGPAALAAEFGPDGDVETVSVHSDGSVRYSPTFGGELFE